MNPGSITIAGPLVRYLRRGVKQELAAIITILQAELDTTLDPTTYRNALARFDEGRTLFDAIGLTDEPEPADVELDLLRWPRLVLRTLESEYAAEVRRLQDANAEGGFALPLRDVPALGNLVAEIRQQAGESLERRPKSILEQLAKRNVRTRKRDHG